MYILRDTDHAGDTITKAQTIYAGTHDCAFDYNGDVDWYAFTAPSTGNYIFSINATLTGYNCLLAVYSKYGHRLAIVNTGSTLSVTLSCAQGEKYYIVAAAPENQLSLYTLSISTN